MSSRKLFKRCLLSVGTLALISASAAVAMSATPAGASPVGINLQSTSPVVAYGSGFATTAVDTDHDLLLFTEASSASSWTQKTLAKSNDTLATEYFDPEIASNGSDGLVIVADNGKGHLESWSGAVGGAFDKAYVATTTRYATASIAYSPAGENFVITDVDKAGDVGFWYESNGAWMPEQVASGKNVRCLAAVVTMTDTGAVVTANGNNDELEVFYQPNFQSGWANTSISPGGYFNISAVWSGSDVLVATDHEGVQTGDETLEVISYTDKGVYAKTTDVGESTTTGDLRGTAIAWSGFNAGVVSKDGSELDFFYSDSSFAFHKEEVAADTSGDTLNSYGPGIAVGNKTVEITDAASNGDLYGFSQAVGKSGWTKQVIAT